MRILIITEIFFPDNVGGAGRHVYLNAKGLIKKGHHVSVITKLNKDLPVKQDIEGIDVNRFKKNPLFLILPFNFIRFIEEVIIAEKIDLIVMNQPLFAFCALLSKEVKNLAKIYNFHSSWFEEFRVKENLQSVTSLFKLVKLIIYSPLFLIMRLIEKCVLLKSDRIIVLSQYSKDKIQNLYRIESAKISVIPGMVDKDEFRPCEDKSLVREELFLHKNKFILFTARNLVPRMGLENLIKAFAQIVKKREDVYLVIAGKGFLEEKLKRLTAKLGLVNDVVFLREVTEKRLAHYYQAADLFILPTKCLEGFGLATLEALSSGLPVLGTPVGGTVEILNKFDSNCLFSGTDVKSIAEKILEFLDKDLKYLSSKARLFAQEGYSSDKILNQTEKMYSETILLWKNGTKKK